MSVLAKVTGEEFMAKHSNSSEVYQMLDSLCMLQPKMSVWFGLWSWKTSKGRRKSHSNVPVLERAGSIHHVELSLVIS